MDKKLTVLLVIIACSIAIPLTADAQVDTEEASSKTHAVIKMSGISPAVGASFRVGNQSKLRVLGFFSTDFHEYQLNDTYFLDFSYIQYNNWIEAESMKSYWGIDLNLRNRDPFAAPGFLAGATYRLSDKFAVFGEAGLSLFLYDEGRNFLLSLSNTGVGMQVGL